MICARKDFGATRVMSPAVPYTPMPPGRKCACGTILRRSNQTDTCGACAMKQEHQLLEAERARQAAEAAKELTLENIIAVLPGTSAEVAEHFEVHTRQHVSSRLSTLWRAGLIGRTGESARGKWRCADEGGYRYCRIEEA